MRLPYDYHLDNETEVYLKHFKRQQTIVRKTEFIFSLKNNPPFAVHITPLWAHSRIHFSLLMAVSKPVCLINRSI